MTRVDTPWSQRDSRSIVSGRRPRRRRVRRLTVELLERRDMLSTAPAVLSAALTDWLEKESRAGEPVLLVALVQAASAAPVAENVATVATEAPASGNSSPDGTESNASEEPAFDVVVVNSVLLQDGVESGAAELREVTEVVPEEQADRGGPGPRLLVFQSAAFRELARTAATFPADDSPNEFHVVLHPADSAVLDGNAVAVHGSADYSIVSRGWLTFSPSGVQTNGTSVGTVVWHVSPPPPPVGPALPTIDITGTPSVDVSLPSAKTPVFSGPEPFDSGRRPAIAPAIASGATRGGYFADDGARPPLGWTIERDAARGEFQAFSLLRPLASGLSDLGRSEGRESVGGERAVGLTAVRRACSTTHETDSESALARDTKARKLRARDAALRELAEAEAPNAAAE
jgi:hypothetical protein